MSRDHLRATALRPPNLARTRQPPDTSRKMSGGGSPGASPACSLCGKQRAALTRCSRCKQASYCGAACQNQAWKGHKKTCVTLRDVWTRVEAAVGTLDAVFEKVKAALRGDDWMGLLRWEVRMENMMEMQPDAACEPILLLFVEAHMRGLIATGNKDHTLSIISLQERRVELLGRMQRFRDQGEDVESRRPHPLARQAHGSRGVL